MKRMRVTNNDATTAKADKIGAATGIGCALLSLAALIWSNQPFGLFCILWIAEWDIAGNVAGIIATKLISDEN